VLTAGTDSDLEAAFATMVQHRVGALIVMPDPFFVSSANSLLSWRPPMRCPRASNQISENRREARSGIATANVEIAGKHPLMVTRGKPCRLKLFATLRRQGPFRALDQLVIEVGRAR
jgi:hypothetical protein